MANPKVEFSARLPYVIHIQTMILLGFIKLEDSIKHAHLIHRQVNASVWDDTQHVGQVAFVKGSKTLSPENLLCTVWDTRVLARLSQSETRLQDLGTDWVNRDMCIMFGIYALL